jgi:hypothetical protein
MTDLQERLNQAHIEYLFTRFDEDRCTGLACSVEGLSNRGWVASPAACGVLQMACLFIGCLRSDEGIMGNGKLSIDMYDADFKEWRPLNLEETIYTLPETIHMRSRFA